MDMVNFLFMGIGAVIFGLICIIVSKLNLYFKSVYTYDKIYTLKKDLGLYDLDMKVTNNFWELRERIEKLEEKEEN